MNAKGDYFAYAVCTHDGQAWEVNTKQGGMCFALDGRYLAPAEAMVAGPAWLLEQLDREPTDDEAAIGRYGKARINDGKHFYSFARLAMMQ